MNRKDVIDYLSQIEKSHPVDQWRVYDIDIWPVFKILVFSSWFDQLQRAQKSDQTSKKEGKKSELSGIVSSLYHWVKFAFLMRKKSRFLFSGATAHRVQYNGASINRFFDPIIDYLEQCNEAPLLLEQTGGDRTGCYRPKRILLLRKLHPIANVYVKLRYKREVIQVLSSLPNLEKCILDVEKSVSGLTAKSLKVQLSYQIQTILVWAFIFDRIFARVKPTYAIGLCYYTLPMFGMNVSAHRNGITSVDMQHGTQGELHPSYANFTKVPAEGYTVMPRLFWCWDKTSANTVKEWSDRQNFHDVLVGGNPWINFILNETRNNKEPLSKKKIILVTLQPVEPMIASSILQAMQLLKDEYEWWLRLHPRQFDDRPRLEKLLAQGEVTSLVNIEDATRLPLPILLQNSVVHISRYSGAIIEAGQIGTPSIVTDEIGVSVFQTEIAEGRAIAYLGQDGAELANVIRERSVHKTSPGENVNFVSTLNEYFQA